MWSSVIPGNPDAKVPSSRSKHASILHGQYLYLLGGRNGNVPLKDFWRYGIADNTWELVKGKGDPPGCLQEHTIVGYRDTLYVFGGEVGFSNGIETPLWMYSISQNEWKKFRAPKGVVTPKGRRSHTATVFQDSLYIYGGYQDLKGSTSELWAFHFASETWHLVSQGGAVDGPPPRHRHSAVLHDSAMWIFGGMTDLQERSDFWRFDFVSRRWRPVKSRPGPGCLHSHCAVKFLSVMMLFGGERDGQILNEMWRFHFATEFWERLTFATTQKPMPRAQTTAFIFSQFTTRGAVHYMGLPEQDYFGSQPDPEKRSITTLPLVKPVSSSKGEESVYEEIDDTHLGSAGHYAFDDPNNCLVDDEDEDVIKSKKTSVYEKLPGLGMKRQPNFQRLVESSTTKEPPSSLIMAKMSNLNLSRLAQYSSYSMFSNESTESLNTAQEKASCHTVESVSTIESPASPVSVKMNFSMMKKSQSMSSSSNDNSPTSKKEISVPNFTEALVHHTEDTTEEENIYETVNEAEIDKQKKESIQMEDLSLSKQDKAGKEVVPRSDSAYTFQSYDCSSRSSTLSTSQDKSKAGDQHKNKNKASGIKLIDLDGELEYATSSTSAYYSGDDLDLSSLSGYESIETGINTLNRGQDKLLSFANPNYLCPDAKLLLERQQKKNIYGETIVPPPSQIQAPLARDESHQSFAAALNSPAESLFSDYQDFHARLNHDLVELNHLRSMATGSSRPKSVVVQKNKDSSFSSTKEPSSSSAAVKLRNRDQQDKQDGTPQVSRKLKTRPLSTGAMVVENKVAPLLTPASQSECGIPMVNNKKCVRSTGGDKNQLSLLMYVVGGRIGQVTVFNRPISMWKLDLTKTF